MSTPEEKRCPDCSCPEWIQMRDGPCCEAEYLRATCTAYALPEHPWIPKEEREAPCVFCGVPGHLHRPMPEPRAEVVHLGTYDHAKAELWIDGERIGPLSAFSYGFGEDDAVNVPIEPAPVPEELPTRRMNRHERRRAAALARRARR